MKINKFLTLLFFGLVFNANAGDHLSAQAITALVERGLGIGRRVRAGRAPLGYGVPLVRVLGFRGDTQSLRRSETVVPGISAAQMDPAVLSLLSEFDSLVANTTHKTK